MCKKIVRSTSQKGNVIFCMMEDLVAIVLVDGWGQVRERPPKTCALYFAILGFLHISWRLYCSNHLFYDWPLGD